MKKILFLIPDLSYGGAEKVLVNLANNLDKNKYDVTIQTLFDVGVNKNYISSDVHYIRGLKHQFRGNSQIMKLFSPKLLCKLLLKAKYDIVVSFLEGPTARILSAYSGKKVAWIHIEQKSIKTACSSFRSFNESKECYSSFDKIICVAKTVKDDFENIYGTSFPVDVLYNVNDTQSISILSKEKQSTILKEEHCFNIISVGRLNNTHKGFDRLINIHKKLLNNGINNKLYILGEGADKEILQQQINKNNLNNSCKLLGFHTNPYKYVKASDLFVCSSHHEGFSTAVTEALILGIPVVSTDVSGAKELLGSNNEYGIVTSNNEESLYKGVETMLSNADTLTKFAHFANIRGQKFEAIKSTQEIEKMLDIL